MVEKYYDLQIQYRSRKANIVTDALSCKTHPNVNAMGVIRLDILMGLWSMGIELVLRHESKLFLCNMLIQDTLFYEIKQA